MAQTSQLKMNQVAVTIASRAGVYSIPERVADQRNPFWVLDQAKLRCTDWDGVIILDAAIYRLSGVTDGLSVVAQMPAFAESVESEVA